MQLISQFDGLYGEPTTQPGREPLYSERLETRSKSFEWLIQPHVHASLFQVFFVESGEVTFAEATQQRHLHSPVVLLVPPAALHGFTYTPNATGHILTLSATLLASLFPGTSPLAPMLGAVQCLRNFAEPYSAAAVRRMMAQLDEEIFGEQPERQAMLHLLLQRLLLVFYRLWHQTETVVPNTNSASIRYFQQFQQRIRQGGSTQSISQLASELAITPTHLNRICHAVAGKSASQLVQQHLLEEACKYLTYTTYSVAEIAYLLHFEYPNYFARFFKKHLGLSPTEYRAAKK